MAHPPNLAEAQALGPGVTPIYAGPDESAVNVVTPEGETLAVDDPLLIRRLLDGIRQDHEITLIRSDRALTDCRPISMFSLHTVRQIGTEVGSDIDKRSFRANVYFELHSGEPFAENQWVGRTLRIGSRVVVAITDRDPRCKMITLDPDSAEANPEVIKTVSHAHDGTAGVYGAVIVEGTIHPGDDIALVP
jgi:hypothetical protein